MSPCSSAGLVPRWAHAPENPLPMRHQRRQSARLAVRPYLLPDRRGSQRLQEDVTTLLQAAQQLPVRRGPALLGLVRRGRLARQRSRDDARPHAGGSGRGLPRRDESAYERPGQRWPARGLQGLRASDTTRRRPPMRPHDNPAPEFSDSASPRRSHHQFASGGGQGSKDERADQRGEDARRQGRAGPHN